MGRKLEVCLLFFWGGAGAGSASNTMSPWPRLTSGPSGILIHPAVCQQCAENWGCALFLGGAVSPSNTKSPGPRPTSIPTGVLVHPAIWPQRTWGTCAPFLGELGPHLIQCGRAEAYLRGKFHLDPSNHLAAVHQHHRQDRTGQTDRTTVW